jgi:hypothetical protein
MVKGEFYDAVNVLDTTKVGTMTSREIAALDPDSLVGTWSLVSASAITASGIRNDAPYGSHPTGILIYTGEGRMAAMISHSDRQPLSGPDRIAAPADERAEAFATFFAYAGRYSIMGDRVVHHVEIASVQNWVNTDMVRLMKLDNDRITLRTPSISVGATVQTTELIWERVR